MILDVGIVVTVMLDSGRHELIRVSVMLSITSFVVIIVTCLSRTTSFNSSEFVWTTFINNTGWKSSAVVFLTGMANPNFMFAGIDGAVHLAEEVSDAAKFVPRALMCTIVIGFITAFGFSLSMLYSLTDFDKVLQGLTGWVANLYYYFLSNHADTKKLACLSMKFGIKQPDPKQPPPSLSLSCFQLLSSR